MNKPYAEACDRNRDPILSVLRSLFAGVHAVLEIGSGTGQHAVYFAENLPHLQWHPSDRASELSAVRAWTEDAGLSNLHAPRELDVTVRPWSVPEVDAVFSANTAHIMHEPAVAAMIAGVGDLLPEGGLFALYGPFNYGGGYTSDSNARFDQWLKARDPGSAIRHFENLQVLASDAGMALHSDIEMPANNRVLCWRKSADG